MGTLRQYGVLVLALLAASCGDNDTPRTVLTAFVDGSYQTNLDDTYIIIHNTEGELIDYKPVETQETVDFQTSAKIPGGKIDVTIARIYPDASGGGLAYLWSYLDVPTGQSWTLSHQQVRYASSREYRPGGRYTMLLSNLNTAVARSISDRYFLIPSTGTTSPLSIIANINSVVPRHLLSLDNGNKLRYQFIEDPKDAETYMIDFNEMKTFDKTISVALPEPSYVFANVMAYETLDDFKYLTGYVLYNSVSDGNKRSSLEVGYLNSMAKFRTEIRLSGTKWSLSYLSRGAAPASISFPPVTAFTFQEKFAHNVTFTNTVPIKYRVSYFMSTGLTTTKGAHWYFYAPEGRTSQPSFPEPLVKKYPSLDVHALRHFSTTFYTKTWPYETFLSREFDGQGRKAEEDEFEDVAVILY
jgi:hypothetical protein